MPAQVCYRVKPTRIRRTFRNSLRPAQLLSAIVIAVMLVPAFPVAPPAAAQEEGVVVGTTGLNIRECPEVSCKSRGLAQLEDPITVTGEEQDGFLPVVWRGIAGWAWYLYVATPATGIPYLEQGSPGCNRLAIIFNIGIGEPLQIQALRWLKKENVPATVFPMGWWAKAFPDDMRTIAMLGFPIGSHGDVRLNLTGFNDDEVQTDVRDSLKHIQEITGEEPDPYFTPYAADIDERVREIVAREGLLPVAWDVAAADWDFGITAQDVYDRVVPNVTDGSIIEMHLDGPSSAESTAAALPKIVHDLRAQGYRFVTIPEMAQPCGAGTPVPSASPIGGKASATPASN
ncbi:MAG: polysaccharide deacetylase family protein [Thermomicrobiales bacterium]